MAEGGVAPTKFHLNCSICLETYKTPKLLPCYHTFCVVCLEKYIDRTRTGNKFSCPLCRKSHEVPKGGVHEFQSNFYIDPGDIKEETVPCEGCPDNIPADHRCVDCEEYFCPRCTVSHSTMKMSRHHRLMELKTVDQSEKRKMKARVFCRKHPNKEIEVVCKQCKQLLCVLCMLTDHQGHKSREVTEEAKCCREKLRAVAEGKEITDTLAGQEKSITDLKTTQVRLKTSQDRDIKEIEDQSRELHQAIDKAVKKMKEKVVNEYDANLDENKAETKMLKTSSFSLKSLVSTAHQVIEQATDIDIIEQSDTLVTQLRDGIDNDMLKGSQTIRQDIDAIFTRGNVDVDVLQNMVGRVGVNKGSSSVKSIRKLAPFKLVKVGDFILTNKRIAIASIVPVGKSRAWICDMSSDLQQIDNDGKSLSKVNVTDFVSCIGSDEKNNCIISCWGSSIRRVTPTGKVETIISCTDGNPRGIAYRRRLDGVEEVMFSCLNVSSGGSAVFVAPYRLDSKASMWSSGYKSVYRIAIDRVTNEVCVVDCGGKCVTILDENGLVLSKYDCMNAEPFNCWFSNQWGILVTNYNSTLPVRRISSDGTFVETLTQVTGVAVAIDDNNHLWVGKDKGVIEVYKVQ